MTHFDDFIDLFPEIKLPIILSEDSSHLFSAANAPIPQRMLDEHLLPFEEETDDYTEYIACFRLPCSEFHAIVFWKAGLMNYHYVMETFTKGGKLIDKRVIAGTYSDGKTITRSIARIDDDWTIYIMTGQVEGSATSYDANLSRAYELELMPDGKIVNC
jgi:hypothetical protein